jgi:hypothetical protein
MDIKGAKIAPTRAVVEPVPWAVLLHNKQMNKWTNEQTIQLINQYNEWINKWMNEWVKKWIGN